MRRHQDELERRGVEVVVVGPDRAAAFLRRFEADGLRFTGLPDPEHRVLDLYGQQVKLLKLGRMPAQVLVDRGGTVRFAYYGSSMSDIPGPEEIEQAVDALNRRAAPPRP